MIRFFLLYILAFSCALLFSYHAPEVSKLVFQEVLSAFIALVMIVGTSSFALYTYVEGVAKDVSSDTDKKLAAGYDSAVASLSSLKKEILVNAFTVIALLLIEKCAHGIAVLFESSGYTYFNWPWAVFSSIRIACFTLSAYVAVVQFLGFIVANELRAVVSGGK
tara:strand:- start:449 stop:940 length:492 start_codon:yes stop_codon:yes gene_type:complete